MCDAINESLNTIDLLTWKPEYIPLTKEEDINKEMDLGGWILYKSLGGK